jgi:DNA-binding transcriptional LysR family regulator
MPAPVTLDQLRTFIAVVDEGSFSAAARKLRRVQSAVSHAMATLEAQLGVKVWDRSTKIATLTEEGRTLLTAARRVSADADALGRIADGLRGGLEPMVALCIDTIFPTPALVALCREFSVAFPTVELRLHVETMRAVADRVLDGTCHLGVGGPLAVAAGLERHHLAMVRMIPVAAPDHPLAAARGKLSREQLGEHVQIVLSERGAGSTPDQAVLSAKTWRIADLELKKALLLAGLGWGNLPEHLIRRDLSDGQLVALQFEAWGPEEHQLALAGIHRPGLAMGPAKRWLLTRIKELCIREVAPLPSGKRRVARASGANAKATK